MPAGNYIAQSLFQPHDGYLMAASSTSALFPFLVSLAVNYPHCSLLDPTRICARC